MEHAVPAERDSLKPVLAGIRPQQQVSVGILGDRLRFGSGSRQRRQPAGGGEGRLVGPRPGVSACGKDGIAKGKHPPVARRGWWLGVDPQHGRDPRRGGEADGESLHRLAPVGQPERVPRDAVQCTIRHDDQSLDIGAEQVGRRLQELQPERPGFGGDVGVPGHQRQQARDETGERVGWCEHPGSHHGASGG
jgi:hypothetical protein